ncbi:MAG: tyrosine-protein phosphatase [Chloroflexi bacterium]|nr:tyrosine-protein phosphatase [Chloroflexota bacterium]
MVSWIIERELAVSSRPGYVPGEERAVSRAVVEAWITDARAAGVRSVICLLGDDQLPLYAGALPEGLLGRYRTAGFEVAHHGVRDGLTEPYTAAQLDKAWASFRRLPKPVLVHCSAGYDRTGRVVRHILGRLEETG